VNSVSDLYCCWLLSYQLSASNYHLSPVLASDVQGDADTGNIAKPE